MYNEVIWLKVYNVGVLKTSPSKNSDLFLHFNASATSYLCCYIFVCKRFTMYTFSSVNETCIAPQTAREWTAPQNFNLLPFL